MNLGDRLLEYRKAKGLSQEEVAEKINVTRQSVSKWETNQSTPDFDKIIPICELYGITPNELVNGVKKEEVEEVNFNVNDSTRQKKKAFGIGIGVFIYLLAIAWIMIAIPALDFNPVVSSAIFLIILGIGTFFIIYSAILYKKEKIVVEETKEEKLINKIDEILAIIFTIIYFLISFYTLAWHITWIIWIIYALVTKIVKLIFMLRSNSDEK